MYRLLQQETMFTFTFIDFLCVWAAYEQTIFSQSFPLIDLANVHRKCLIKFACERVEKRKEHAKCCSQSLLPCFASAQRTLAPEWYAWDGKERRKASEKWYDERTSERRTNDAYLRLFGVAKHKKGDICPVERRRNIEKLCMLALLYFRRYLPQSK